MTGFVFNIPRMTPAEEALAKTGVCPGCKTGLLGQVHCDAGMLFTQCQTCRDITVLAASKLKPTAEQAGIQGDDKDG